MVALKNALLALDLFKNKNTTLGAASQIQKSAIVAPIDSVASLFLKRSISHQLDGLPNFPGSCTNVRANRINGLTGL